MAPTTPGRSAVICAGGASGPAYQRTPGGEGGPGVVGPIAFAPPPTEWPGGAVERLFAWFRRGFRRLALRYERQLATFAALVYLACFPVAWRLLR
jgi:hypothetical protein